MRNMLKSSFLLGGAATAVATLPTITLLTTFVLVALLLVLGLGAAKVSHAPVQIAAKARGQR